MKPQLQREVADLVRKVLRQEAYKQNGLPLPKTTEQPERKECTALSIRPAADQPHNSSPVEQPASSSGEASGFAGKLESYAPIRLLVRFFHSSGLRKLLRRALWLFSPACVGLVASLVTFFPKINVQAGTPLDPTNAFSAPFEVSYEGPIPIKSVSFSCILEEVVMRERVVFQGLRTVTKKTNVSWMFWGDSETVFCQSPAPHLHAAYARIYIAVEFNPAGVSMIHKWKAFKFESVRQRDGGFRWIKRAPYWSWAFPGNAETAPETKTPEQP